MKIYLINSESEAKQISQLLKLNAECAKLHWSKIIKELPADVISSLETLETFVEEKVYGMCTEKTLVSSLCEDEEMAILALLREVPELRTTLGMGVIMAGEEAGNVAEILQGKMVPEDLITAINSGKNVVLF